MFNENDGKWIGYYKRITVAFFWIYIVAGLFFGLDDCCCWFMDLDIGGGDDGFLDLMIWIVLGGVVGFSQLVSNMLIIQLLNNVQTIRETVTSRASKQEANSGLEELKKYKKLLDMEVITAEEYETKKAKLLEQI